MMGRLLGSGAVAHTAGRVGEKEIDRLVRQVPEDLAAVTLDNIIPETTKHVPDS
jgi:hypothetical protein